MFRDSNPNNNPNNQKWKNLIPHRLFLSGCLLLDDSIHRGVTRTAEGIERASNYITRGGFPLTKKRLALTTGILGCSASVSIELHKNNGVSKLAFAFYVILLPSILTAIIKISMEEATVHPSASVETVGQRIVRMVRFPFLLIGATALYFGKMSDNFPSLGIGFYNLGFAVAFYLSSSSNGILDYVKDAVKNFLKQAKDTVAEFFTPKPEPERIPVSIGNEERGYW